ncbi:carbohydrate-binding module family 18 protein [Rutstroemia sp. NJR-2017a WRK4]|nr:carbohydrate-binding module family 18 protein [Rutstroemia sp. NJR-2017a WRK4]
MSPILKHLFLSLILSTLVLSELELDARSANLDAISDPSFHTSTHNGTSLPAQDGRSLVRSWLSPRYLTCYSGYGLCPDNTYCCPLSDRCCEGGGCVEPGGKCCAGYTCDPGWNCCASPYCYPDGANCCSDGGYCLSGSVCVKISGLIKCSTTGGYSGPTLSATSAVFTAPPAESTIAVTSRTSVASITLPPVYQSRPSSPRSHTKKYARRNNKKRSPSYIRAHEAYEAARSRKKSTKDPRGDSGHRKVDESPSGGHARKDPKDFQDANEFEDSKDANEFEDVVDFNFDFDFKDANEKPLTDDRPL